MRSTRDRVCHAISFELGGLALISPLGAWAFSMPVADITVVRIACAIIATLWTYLYNLAFDAILQRITGGIGKSIPVRVLHAVLFEVGLLAMLTPLMAWYQPGPRLCHGYRVRPRLHRLHIRVQLGL
jgi:uncharacterized membrane protein